jgi:8-oxo-dGTP pyrophosphatase MutT (NUDIX family)
MFYSNKNKNKNKNGSEYPPCTNCGLTGHSYKSCLAPVNSYGIIACRLKNENNLSGECSILNELTNEKLITGMENVKVEFLLIRRKDSLRFVDFIRGKYSLDDNDYLKQMLSNMTTNERQLLIDNNFNDLWIHVWGLSDKDYTMDSDSNIKILNKNNIVYKSDYEQSKIKFTKLKESNKLIELIHNTKSIWNTPEWGFPKGRRNPYETDIQSAVREFKEETGLDDDKFKVIINMDPLSETFYGDNKVHYCHKYYLAICNSNIDIIYDKSNEHMLKEIGDIGWYDLDEALKRIRSENVEKREILLRVSGILRNYCIF